jgi:hypothetical protein
LGRNGKSSPFERAQDRNLAEHTAATAELQGDQRMAGEQIPALQRHVLDQAHELEKLRLLVHVLPETLIDLASSAPTSSTPGWRRCSRCGPPRQLRPAPRRSEEPMITCAACNTAFPASKTVITARGTVCDRCSVLVR